MIKQNIKIILILVFICAGFFCFGKSCWAANAGDVVISEVFYDETGTDANEFVELYNPDSSNIDISNWKLKHYNQKGTLQWTLVFDSGATINSFSYYLIGQKNPLNFNDWGGNSITSDAIFPSNKTLQNGPGDYIIIEKEDGTYVDGVRWGDKDSGDDIDSDPPYNDVKAGNSIERKSGEIHDETKGNGYDTDNNANDFITRDIPEPQNSNSPSEPPSDEISNGDSDDSDNGTDDGGDDSDNNNVDYTDEEIEETLEEETIEYKIIETYKLGDIVINEFVSDPADEEVEWIELYNTTSKEINLDGWTIKEGSGAKTTLEGVMGSRNENKFFVIEKPKGNLNNKGDIIILRDNNETLIDQVAYGSWDDGNIENNAPMTGDPYGVARKFDGQNSFNNLNDFAVTATLTKGASNIITKTEEEQELDDEISAEEKALYDYSNGIIITEIFPNPAGSDSEDEFIELYNKSERDVNLLGWRLGDESKKKYEIANLSEFKVNLTNTVIKVDEYLVIYRSESKIVLNNGSDSVKLYQPLKDEPLQVVKYEKSIEGWSYNLDEELRIKNYELRMRDCDYVWSETVTPGETNIIKTINHPPTVDFDCHEEILVGAPTLFDSSDTVDEDNDELKFYWDFGDGATNILAIAEHTFFKQGAYTVKLTVSDGENEVEKEKIVKVVDNNEIAAPISEGEIRESRLQLTARNNNIIINEFLPNPEGADAEGEFIELYNQGGGDVNLINWKVDDSEGGSKPYTFDIDLWLGSEMYYMLDREESGLALNNTTDAVRLFDNFNELIEEIEYEAVIEGEAYARGKNGKWFWTTVVTPGEENIISVADSNEAGVIVKSASYSASNKESGQIIETTLEKIIECEVGDLVKVAGIVAVEPGVLGSQYFYIVTLTPNPSSARSSLERGAKEITKLASVDFIPDGAVQNKDDASDSISGDSDEDSADTDRTVYAAGIQVYNYKKDFPSLKIGDYIEVHGELSVSSGELRLKTKTVEDFKIIEHGDPPIANETSCEQINEEYVGQLVSVSGEVVERKSSIVYLDDGTDEVIIYIKTATGINPKSIKEGEMIAVTGLVGRTKSGIRIMPRFSDDIIKKDPQSQSGEVGHVLGEVSVSDVWEIAQRDKKIELFKYLLILAGGVIVVLGGLLVKEVRKG